MFVSGCGGTGGTTAAEYASDESLARPGSEPTVREVQADWDDLVGAFDLAASESEIAVFSLTQDNGGARWYDADSGRRIRWDFVSVRGDEGWLEATRADASDAAAIRLTCRIDDPPKPRAEEALVARLVARLERLRGQRAAPIGEPFGVPAQ